MGKISLTNIKTIPIEIGVLISSNERLQKLLTIDTNDLSGDFSMLSFNELTEKKYISFVPVANAIDNIGRSSFIVIVFDNINLNRGEVNGVVYVGVDKDHSMLTKNLFRPMEICNEILKAADEKKLTAAGVLSFSNITTAVYSEFVSGFKMYFRVADQETEEGVEL